MALSDAPSQVDYIIVGGGLAGCALASRIRQGNSLLSILIIEAGSDPTGHPLTSPYNAPATHYSDLDWAYKSVPQRHLNGRAIYCAAGKAISGGSATNYGMWTRGPAIDYDRWGEIVGDPAWSYEGLLPYFRKTETHHDRRVGTRQHGFDGPIHNSPVSAGCPDRQYPLQQPLREMCSDLEIEYIPDANSGTPLGLSELTENWRYGERQLACRAYDLSGVEILLQTMVQSVIIKEDQGRRIAKGVQLTDGRTILATHEVILSAGAYRTPQLLLLSGIGPAADLSRHGIRVIHESPEVGRNFHDHLALPLWWKVRKPELGMALGAPQWKTAAWAKGSPADWVLIQQTPRAQMKAVLDAERNATESEKYHRLHPQGCHHEIVCTYAPVAAQILGVQLPIDGTIITTTVVGMTPSSRGSITISDADVSTSPVIDQNFYATEIDRVALRHGVRQALCLMQKTTAGQEYIEKQVLPPGLGASALHYEQSSDDEIDAQVRSMAISCFHPAGSAAMGKVVDTQLRVYGVEGLRIVDASVLPVPLAAHYQACVYAIAEKAADYILESAPKS